MFDWFKDVTNAANGIDIEALKKEQEEQREKERQSRYIFSAKTKVWIIILAVVYIVLTAVSTVAINDMPGMLLQITKNIIMVAVALFIIISLLVGKRKGEVFALAGIFIFLLGLFVSLSLM